MTDRAKLDIYQQELKLVEILVIYADAHQSKENSTRSNHPHINTKWRTAFLAELSASVLPHQSRYLMVIKSIIRLFN